MVTCALRFRRLETCAIVVFFFLNLSLIEVPMFFIIILAGCYAVLAIGVFVLAYLATSTDPTDPTIKA